MLIYSGTHSILGNAIYSNVGLGIDFNNDGVTPNDEGDADTGPNNLQNFPRISTVTAAGGNVTISGSLNSTPEHALNILVRAIGLSLLDFGVLVSLTDPFLELHDGNGTLLASNDNWKDMQQTEIEATGIPPTDDNESAILQSLTPGAYTAIVRGKADTTGVGLVEVYHMQ